jgi:hypothetical protein
VNRRHWIHEHNDAGAPLDCDLDGAAFRNRAVDNISLADTNWTEEHRDRAGGRDRPANVEIRELPGPKNEVLAGAARLPTS